MCQQSAAKLFIGGIGGVSVTGLLGFVAYDYQTRHPMRQMQQEIFYPSESMVRLHNTLLRKLPSFGRSLSLSELKQFDGKNGRGTYFAAGGSIYDVTTSTMFASSYNQWAGRDATVALARMSLDKADINKIDWDSLSAAELESLKSWMDYFDQRYYIKGWLKEWPFSER